MATKIAIKQFRSLAAKGQNLEMITQSMRFVGICPALKEETFTLEQRDFLINLVLTLVNEAEVLQQQRHFLRHQTRQITQQLLLWLVSRVPDLFKSPTDLCENFVKF